MSRAELPALFAAFVPQAQRGGRGPMSGAREREEAERRRADEALRRSSDLMRAVLEGTTDAVFVKDAEGRYLLCNAATARFLARTVEEVVGRTDAELLGSESPKVVAADRRVMASGTADTSEECFTVGDVTRTFLATKGPYRDGEGRIIGVVGVSRDITERKAAEEALRASEERYRRVFDAGLVGTMSWDEDGSTFDANDEYLRIIGYTREDLHEGRINWREVTPPEHIALDEKALAEMRATGRCTPFEKEYIRKDGSRIPVLLGGTTFHGSRERGVAFALDLSARNAARADSARLYAEARDAEARLRRELAFSKAVTEGVGDGLLGLARSGRVMFVNPAAERLLGARAASLIGKQAHDALHGHADAKGQAHGAACTLQLVLGRTAITRGDDVFSRRDGTTFPVTYTAAPMRAGGEVIGQILSFRDMTEQHQLQEQLRHSQKMEAFGRLAGGVAHDFNNLLTVINGYSDLLLEDLPAGDDGHRQVVTDIRDAGERAASLTRQLLAFSRKQVLQPKLLDVNQLVVGMGKMLTRVLGEDISVQLTLAPAVGAVRADPGQLEQVLMNLAVNSRDAMPAGGELALRTESATLDGKDASIRGMSAGRYVQLLVSDTGCGMDEATRSRIFEPFFTTKPQGQGTGLGLATVYGIVEQSGGHVGVVTAPGRGTTFEILLPAVTEKPLTGDRLRSDVPRGNETILLVEDEPSVRRLGARLLGAAGYTVLDAGDGEEALQRAREHAGAIDLLVTDVVMRGMSGREVADAVRAIRPDVLVLYVSGYTDDAVVLRGVSNDDQHFLQKPFQRASLARKVREILDRGQAASE